MYHVSRIRRFVLSQNTITRRQLFGMIFGGATVGGVLAKSKKDTPTLLRPPGAQPESDFLAACIRCGQCVEACPYDSLKLATATQGTATAGTPYLVAREVPCHLCQNYGEMRCIPACPTQALQPLAEKSDVEMGVAVVNPNTCLAWNGVMCRACWHICPFPNTAIDFDLRGRPNVYPESCVGCGLCEFACPTKTTSITIIPSRTQEAE